MNARNHKLFSLVLAASAAGLLSLVAAAGAATTNKQAVERGVKWIRGAGLSQFPGTGFRSDALSALVAARLNKVSIPAKTRDRFLNSVGENANSYVGSAGESGKVILAAVAGGKNPRCFGKGDEKSDFLDALSSYYNSKTGQYGKSAFDQALAMLALKSAHAEIPKRAVRFARDSRGRFGWGFAMRKRGGDDVESTAMMIQAMRAAGVRRSDAGLKSAFKWIVFQRNADGGYNPATQAVAGETQADATAYAIMAGSAMKLYANQMNRAKVALRTLQQKNGSFRSAPSANSEFHGISTSNAVLALSGRHFPVVSRSKSAQACG